MRFQRAKVAHLRAAWPAAVLRGGAVGGSRGASAAAGARDGRGRGPGAANERGLAG